MKNAGKARSYGLYRHLRTSKEIIENLLNYYTKRKDYFKNFLELTISLNLIPWFYIAWGKRILVIFIPILASWF